ncbi:MAG: hypothetical protein GXY86_13990 [Firmicutes bacterium]|nr:hypothetical protein [Bacillota bacterium]
MAGINLRGVDKALVSVARTSFNYMVLGAAIGLVAGIIPGVILFRKKKR